MTQRHVAQRGLFHVTTNAKGRIPWCTFSGIPEILIENLFMTRNLHRARVFAFCILPDHQHLIVSPGEAGLSAFMHSFIRNAMRDIRSLFGHSDPAPTSTFPPSQRKIVSSASFTDSASQMVFVRAQYTIDDIAWQKSFHDEILRDTPQRDAALAYVRGNAARHGLVTDPADWPWSSLRFPGLVDGFGEEDLW